LFHDIHAEEAGAGTEAKRLSSALPKNKVSGDEEFATKKLFRIMQTGTVRYLVNSA